MSRVSVIARRTGERIVRTVEVTFLFLRLATMLGFLAVVVAGAVIFLKAKPELPDRFTLHLSLPGSLTETPSLAAALTGTPSLRSVLQALDAAARDPRVTAVFAEIGPDSFSFAQAQEITGALARVHAAGKRTIAWTDSFGEMSSGFGAYWLASGFAEIALQPAGTVNITGLAVETTHYGALLADLGIDVLMGQREQYKTVNNHLLYGERTAAETEMLRSIADDLTGQAVEQIAVARHLTADAVRFLIDTAPHDDADALARGLIDRLAWRDEIIGELGGAPALVPVGRYIAATRDRRGGPRETRIALVSIAGLIERGQKQGVELLQGAPTLGAARIVRSIDRAAGQDDIAGIVLRIDSPGGSPAAAETVRRAVERARATGKPVIVSMAGIAGSGAYWLAVDADRIVAQPATLTGSIGVAGGKVAIHRLLRNFDVTTGTVEASPTAGMWSMFRGWNGDEDRRRDRLLDDTYRTFLERVAQGRGLPLAQVEAIAKGRVWTGRQALALGLVDALGGLDAALDEARAVLGLPADAPISIVDAAGVGDPGSLIPDLLQALPNLAAGWVSVILDDLGDAAGLQAVMPALRTGG